ncbi:MAG: response regulator [Candidatus Delongbacteria bacterium]|nr:response regulator [Candidatus Delongbacteria bacterium]MDD4205179.1 response regulator [Candidatus Delongbacteria bacterium]
MADTKKILVVDDEAIMRDLLTDFFEMMDYGVMSAKDGSVAMEIITESQPGEYSLVITDINMPKMGGIELFKSVKSKYPDMPIILMTGYGIEKVRQDVEKADGFLAKPFELDDLNRLVSKILA